MVPPGQLCVYPPVPGAFRIIFPHPSPFLVPFLPVLLFFLLFLSPFFPFALLCASVCIFLFAFCYLLLFLALLRRLPFRFISIYFFCFPGVLGNRVHIYYVCMFVSSRSISVLTYTPRVACEPVICQNLRIMLCVLRSCFVA